MREDGVKRNAVFALGARLISAALTGVLIVVLARQLSAGDYGAFAFALSLGMLVALPADLGLSASASRFVGERRGDLGAAGDVVRTTLRLKLPLAVAASVALLALAAPIAHVFGLPEATWAVRGIAVSALGETLFGFVLATFGSLARIRFSAATTVVESITELTASLVLVALGAGATGAAFGRAVGYGVGAAFGLMMLSRLLGPLRRRVQPGASGAVSRASILRYAAPLVAVDAAFKAFESIDVLLIAALLGNAGQVAAFQLPMRLVVFLELPVAALGAAVAPRLVRGADAVDVDRFVRALRLATLLQMLFVAPLLVWPEAIVHVLFASKYPEAPGVLRALVPFVVLSGVAFLVSIAVNFLGEGRRRVPVAVVMVAANVLIDVALLRTLGVVAAAIGTSVAYLIWVPAHIRILHEVIGLSYRALALTTLRALVAALVTAGALAALGTGVVPVWRMAVGLLVGPAVYLMALTVTGELRRQDAVALRRLLP